MPFGKALKRHVFKDGAVQPSFRVCAFREKAAWNGAIARKGAFGCFEYAVPGVNRALSTSADTGGALLRHSIIHPGERR